MAFQSVPDCAQATILGSLNGVTINTTLTFAFAGGGYGQSDIDALGVAVDDWFATEILPSLNPSAAYNGTEIRGLESLIDLEALNQTSIGNGAHSGTPLPALTAFCISFRTGYTGRSARGRNYVWGLSTDAMGTNENEIAAATALGLANGYEEIPTYLSGTNWAHVVVSRYTSNALRTTGVYLPITTYTYTDLLWDTQRRRR